MYIYISIYINNGYIKCFFFVIFKIKYNNNNKKSQKYIVNKLYKTSYKRQYGLSKYN
jgi:hypothetical protein